jgi:TniQ
MLFETRDGEVSRELHSVAARPGVTPKLAPGVLLHVRLRPLSGESIYSWLHRLARANGFLTIRQMLNDLSLKGLDRSDFDLVDDDRFFATLSRACMLDESQVRALSLRSLEGSLARSFPRSAYHQWLLRSVPRHSGVHPSARYMFCPRCVAEDAIPFWRFHWRVAALTVCEKHQCLLLEDCPACGRPYQLDCLAPQPLNVCPNCGELVISPQHEVIPESALRFAKLVANCGRNAPEDFAVQFAYEFQFWDGVWTVLTVIRTGLKPPIRLGKDFPSFVAEALETFALLRDEPVGTWDVESRAQGMVLAAWLFDEWPKRLIALLSALNILGGRLSMTHEVAPFWIRSLFNQHLSRPKPTISAEQVVAAASHIARSGKTVSKIAIKRQLGITESRALSALFDRPRKKLDVDCLDRIISYLQIRLAQTHPRRAARAALVRDIVVITLAFLSGKTFQQLVGIRRYHAAAIWSRSASAEEVFKLRRLSVASREWREEYEKEVRPTFARHTSDRECYLLDRFGEAYGCHGTVAVFADALRAAEYPHPERGCKVVTDLCRQD